MRNIFLLLIFAITAVAGTPGRETHKISTILTIVQRIEEQLGKEDRLREITDIVRIDSTLDKMTKKLDRITSLLEGSRTPPTSFGRSSSTAVAEVDRDVAGRLDGIDERLGTLETSMEQLEDSLNKANLHKINDIEGRLDQVKDDLDKKLRKMMNTITALYEMNKEMKVNFGGRSNVMSETPHPAEPNKPNFASEFLMENLEELERKIKEQFSVLSNEIRSEIAGLKLVASSVGDGCKPSVDFDYDELSPVSPDSNPQKSRSSRREGANRKREQTGIRALDNNSLDTLVQSLGQTTKEIKEEIQQGIQAIDLKLSNLTNLPYRCDESLDALDSIVQPVRVSREFSNLAPQQSLDKKAERKKESCTKIAINVPSPKSCAELRQGGADCDGAYIIFLKNTLRKIF